MDFRNRSTKVIRSTWSVLSNTLTKMQRGGGAAHRERQYRHEIHQDNGKNTDKVLKPNQTKSSIHSHKSIRKLLSSKGAILVEFAISIPVLVALMYYVHDIPKLARMKARMEFAAHCAVNMIQNQGKKITRQDLGRIFSAASLVVYPGMTQYLLRSNRYTYGHFPIAYLFYVKGLGEEKATVMWMWDSGSQGTVPFSGSCRRSEAASDANFSTTRFLVRYKINAKQEDIYKDLKISKDEVKMIVYFSHRTHNGFCFFDNSAVNIYDGKKLFGFWILPPKPIEAYPSTGAGWLNYFSIALIFTPKPGLFSETPPQ